MHESFIARVKRVYQQNGFAGFLKKGFRAAIKSLEPLKAIIYPYANWRLPKDVRKSYTAEDAIHYGIDHFWGFISSTQVHSEIVSLGKIVEQLRPKTVVEIGTSKGGTLFIWARLASKEAHLVSIDMPGGENNWAFPAWKEPFYKKFASKGQHIDILRGDSQSPEMLARLKSILGGKPIDYLFIDADHTYEGVKKDYLLYSPLVRQGGVIAFHDIAKQAPITGCGVDRLWNEAKQGKKFQEFIENPNQGWGGIGVIFV